MGHCFDTSAFLQCWARYYPVDVFPGLWEKLSYSAAVGQILAPEEVRDEIAKKEDGLYAWVKDRPHIFVPLDTDIQDAVRVILAEHRYLVKNTAQRNAADPWVIAVAKVRGLTVVTEERGGTTAKPRIPSVCEALGVPCISVVEYIREKGWQF
jgi:hypothetical protein